MKTWRHAWWIAGSCMMLTLGAQAFEVGRNVNHDRAEDKLVLFGTGQGLDHLQFTTDGDCAAQRMDDGRLRLTFRGRGLCLLTLRWKAGASLPASIDMADYQALRLVCHMEGDVRVTPRRGGQATEEDLPDLTTLSVMLLDGAGSRVRGGSLTEFAPGGKTPRTSSDVLVYLSALSIPKETDTADIRNLVFRMAPRDNLDRDYHLIIEKISLTE